ncbi:MAG: M48 family metalloprotease [Deferribacteres bacterium]|nr:M48 family metalloprotease [Deferribacteres bacterium]
MKYSNYKVKGLSGLPNLFIRSAMVLMLLYALLTFILIALTIFTPFTPTAALVIGVVIAVFQFLLAPPIIDKVLEGAYSMSWVRHEDLPVFLRDFITRTCSNIRMKNPRIGIIRDGAPNAFTYGHTPNNARIVLTRGIMDLLNEDEVKGVVAHEIAHARHWDMLIMTAAQLVPLVLYYIYRMLERASATLGGNGDSSSQEQNSLGASLGTIALVSFILYIVSEYMVLWLSRAREYFADRFAGWLTRDPESLASGLVKIGYGLAGKEAEHKSRLQKMKEQSEKDRKKYEERDRRLEAVGALGIFDTKSAAALAVSSLPSVSAAAKMGTEIDKENLKAAMRWELWNPWAKYYELASTHPLVASRIHHLGRLSEMLGREPFIRFDEKKPESYWKEFLVDMFIKLLPLLVFIGFLAAAVVTRERLLLAAGISATGFASFLKARFSYRFGRFPERSVSDLLAEVKVSGIRPVPCRVKGTIIGRGIPGLVWSEDFVLQDDTGIIFLDYKQPLPLWDTLFGMFKRARYDNQEAEVTGWYRRSPVPRIEIEGIKVPGEKERKCYTYAARYVLAGIIAVAGLVFGCYMIVTGYNPLF